MVSSRRNKDTREAREALEKVRDKSWSDRLVRLGHLQIEKCEVEAARETFFVAVREARQEKDIFILAEALVGLLRLAGESLNEAELDHWDRELDRILEGHEAETVGKVSKVLVPPIIWYGKGAASLFKREWHKAQKFYHLYYREVKKQPGISKSERSIGIARALAMCSNAFLQKGKFLRAEFLSRTILKIFEDQSLRGINGVVYLLMGRNYEQRNHPAEALTWYQKAHAAFLEEHNWYHHLYALYGYARIYRIQGDLAQARWYLNLIEKATRGSGFALLQREVATERERLDENSFDLWIDADTGVVRTREAARISIRKQYVLLEILRALSRNQAESGLSKAQLIQWVWGQKYRPAAHDNKLYYNINRLRKMIEPDAHHPKYLLNCKEGYRWAPGLKVQFIDSTKGSSREEPIRSGSPLGREFSQ